jgi:hypothetical protein
LIIAGGCNPKGNAEGGMRGDQKGREGGREGEKEGERTDLSAATEKGKGAMTTCLEAGQRRRAALSPMFLNEIREQSRLIYYLVCSLIIVS